MNIIKCFGRKKISYRKVRPLWLVIHYSASTNSHKGRALATAKYFESSPADASADFEVDDATIVQYNPDPLKYYCWAVGDPPANKTTSLSGKYRGVADNENSISIEMCSQKADGGKSYYATDKDWSISESVINNTIELVAYLMKLYNIDIDHVIMHHMISGKLCPAPWTQNEAALSHWYNFKQRLEDTTMTGEQIYNLLNDYLKTLPESNWSITEGGFGKAKKKISKKTGKPISDGSAPRGFITREQLNAILYRLSLLD